MTSARSPSSSQVWELEMDNEPFHVGRALILRVAYDVLVGVIVAIILMIVLK